ncbi:hypothetical protein EYC80_001268 [Monilinia laxa]|uniref:Uncharacterized protein n=1 Tax=Monilinia laxa TaxID=61186 RepID=A0A5N6K8R8_MONLA|nr:hypothetical protein EYC80_001268 [Monilinia laxa]
MAEHVGAVPPIDITNFNCQTRKQRFQGNDFLQKFYDAQVHTYHLPSDAKTTCLNGTPLPSTWRMNLIALSQKYNIYFAAFKDTIHVTRPRTLKQILPGVPDLILRLPVSKNAGPAVFPDRPHCINHMMVGNLGSKEILLFCCDDGDVTAYYTDLIAEELQQQTVESVESSIPIANTQPFFLENVGMSAWGLAIHKKSRLIAVSSNKREVTVFVHGTYGKDACNCANVGTVLDPAAFDQFVQHGNTPMPFPTQECRSTGFRYLNDGIYEDSSFPLRCKLRCTLENATPATRCSRNFRIILKPGSPRANIPAISFADDNQGLAESVIATDISGNLWSLGIWQESYTLLGKALRDDELGQPQMGWGVMTIPLRYFKLSPNFQDALAIDDLEPVLDESLPNRKGITCINITSSMRRVDLYPRVLQDANDENPHPPMPDNLRFLGANLNLSVDDIMAEISGSQSFMPTSTGITVDLHDLLEGYAENHERFVEPIRHTDSSTITNSAYYEWNQGEEDTDDESPPNWLIGLDKLKRHSSIPYHLRMIPPVQKFTGFVERVKSLIAENSHSESPLPTLSNGAVILRSWQDSIELLPSSPIFPPSTCSDRFFRRGSPRAFGRRFQHLSRVNMMALIPELSLVVVACQNGQAALLTLTAVNIPSCNAPVTTFRVEDLLPPRKYGTTYLIGHEGPKPPLLGMAVSPIQKGEGIKLNAGKHPKKWRLIMQSYDHTVWTYELSRDENNNLCSSRIRYQIVSLAMAAQGVEIYDDGF